MLISLVAALVVVGSVVAWIRAPQPKEMTETVCTADGREEVRKWVTAVFPQTAKDLRIQSCDAGATAFAGFWHISAEVAPGSCAAIEDFEPLRDPGWIPIQLMADGYVRQFENADWQKVQHTGDYHRNSGVRVFLIKAEQGQRYVIITSQ